MHDKGQQAIIYWSVSVTGFAFVMHEKTLSNPIGLFDKFHCNSVVWNNNQVMFDTKLYRSLYVLHITYYVVNELEFSHQ